mmetsp:Transcript_42219/g.68404  ORF Transcript_42219/g.68404 Transcript_42219/m.68404 type:complete len:175 (+) Transcript_42219:95-619(+)
MARAIMFSLLSAILLEAVASKMSCPGSKALMHAKTQVAVDFPTSTCSAVRSEVLARLGGASGWRDPHNGGIYTLLSHSAHTVEAKRLTGDRKYTDLIEFTFTESGSGCHLDGCSESQGSSYLDFSTNYCNMYILYCGSAAGCPIVSRDFSFSSEEISRSSGAGMDKSKCLPNVA